MTERDGAAVDVQPRRIGGDFPGISEGPLVAQSIQVDGYDQNIDTGSATRPGPNERACSPR